MNRGGGGGDDSFSSLQEGLFQIASQTCNILVQVNNTNISYGNNATNVTYGGGGCGGEGSSRDTTSSSSRYDRPSTSRSASDVHFSASKRTPTSAMDREQSVDLLAKRENFVKRNSNLFANYKHRLSVSYRKGHHRGKKGRNKKFGRKRPRIRATKKRTLVEIN